MMQTLPAECFIRLHNAQQKLQLIPIDIPERFPQPKAKKVDLEYKLLWDDLIKAEHLLQSLSERYPPSVLHALHARIEEIKKTIA